MPGAPIDIVVGVDDDFRVRFASKFTADGGNLYLKPDGKGGWSDFLKIPMTDTLTTHPIGFDKTGDQLYLIDSRGRNTGAFATLDRAITARQRRRAKPCCAAIFQSC